jgi:hypothetical protein
MHVRVADARRRTKNATRAVLVGTARMCKAVVTLRGIHHVPWDARHVEEAHDHREEERCRLGGEDNEEKGVHCLNEIGKMY